MKIRYLFIALMATVMLSACQQNGKPGKDIDEALQAAMDEKEALVLKPDAYYIWDTLAWLYFENGEQEKAVEASTKALGLAPKDQHDA